MSFAIIIPVYNEEIYLNSCLQSFVNQTVKPDILVLVDDNSTDNSYKIIQDFAKKYLWIKAVKHTSKAIHLPGKKVINAFNFGLKSINYLAYDFIGKFDADLILPNNYFERALLHFNKDAKVGLVGGVLYIEKDSKWILEDLSNLDHIRGAIKLYRNTCFEAIGGLRNDMGWDTLDELLARYHGFTIVCDPKLVVKHLKPTGVIYDDAAKYKQGEAFFRLRYRFLLTCIAALKLAYKKKSFSYFVNTIMGFIKAKQRNISYLVTKEEGKFIRKLRWKGIQKKLSIKKGI